MPKYLTEEGLNNLKRELKRLETVERKKIAKLLKEAIAQGDLKENAGYQVTKENQAQLEARIRELKEIIAQTKVIEKKAGGKVQLGSLVRLKSEEGEQEFQIVGPEEANVLEGKISFKSPLGSAILNKKKGDAVRVKTPEGQKEYKIVGVE